MLTKTRARFALSALGLSLAVLTTGCDTIPVLNNHVAPNPPKCSEANPCPPPPGSTIRDNGG